MKIEFHYTYIIMAISFIICGYIHNLIVFTSIILIHEMGHYITAKINKFEIKKLIIYPFGGLLKTNILINTNINKELIVALSGLIFQSIYFILIIFLYKIGIIREYIFNLFKIYNISIFTFNILPIYPLDGSKILNLLLYKILPYNIVNKLSILISLITIFIIINYYKFNYTTILILGIIFNNIIKFCKELKYLFNKLLLERYLYNIKYPKIKYIKNINYIYKEKYHIIKTKDEYITETKILKHRFKNH